MLFPTPGQPILQAYLHLTDEVTEAAVVQQLARGPTAGKRQNPPGPRHWSAPTIPD